MLYVEQQGSQPFLNPVQPNGQQEFAYHLIFLNWSFSKNEASPRTTSGRQTTGWEPMPALESDQLSSQQSASRPDYLVMSFDPATIITNLTSLYYTTNSCFFSFDSVSYLK